jgi:hypothetical protein
MVGCAGHVTYANRATLCASGFRVCSAVDWNTYRGSTAPTHHYWTSDVLYAGHNDSDGDCAVSTTHHTGDWCDNVRPMRVCRGDSHYDAENNHCNWIHCGLETHSNQYFGGCNDDTYAGALCCPQ